MEALKQGIVTRPKSSPNPAEGTISDFELFGETGLPLFKCKWLELPWHDNAPGRSCVPLGSYFFKLRRDSPKHGTVYEEWDDPLTVANEDVPNRANIQIHAANLAGDEEQGYIKQLDGCMAPGAEAVRFRANVPPAGAKSQMGVTASAATLKKLMAILNGETFRVTIKEAA